MSGHKQPARAKKPQAKRILVVEDDERWARMVRLLLEGEGYAVETAGTVQAAAMLALANPFDLIVSDLGLPDADGEELFAFIAAQRTPAIALTGYGSPEDRRHSEELGFAAHLVKPVDPEHLFSTIEQVLASNVPAPHPVGGARQHGP